MNLWKWACKHIEAIYWIMFFVGAVLFVLSWVFEILSQQSVLSSFPIVAGIAAAYFWIRRDVWRDDKTIRNLTSSNDAADDFISQRSDSQVALVLLIFVAVAQSLLLLLDPKTKWDFIVLLTMLFMLIPLCNWIARWMEESQKTEFNNKS